jgi:hypothetical protein
MVSIAVLMVHWELKSVLKDVMRVCENIQTALLSDVLFFKEKLCYKTFC